MTDRQPDRDPRPEPDLPTDATDTQWRPAAREPEDAELSEIALGALARFQDAARSRGDMRRGPRRPRPVRGEDTDEGGPALVDPADPTAGAAYLGGAGGGPSGGATAPAPATSSSARTRWRSSPGLAASRTRWNEPGALGSVIGRMSKRRGWDGPAAMGSVMAKWSLIVGDQVAEHCHIETFEGARLVVRCSSTAWTKQLRLLLPHIERRIEEEVGPGVVTQVVVRGPAAPSWKKGRLSVPGRGPRDTYG